ncbi:hypothetical protein NUS55_01295 [Glaesserella parasuis]|nr:hypothetical protein [Glaesserella parasuis]
MRPRNENVQNCRYGDWIFKQVQSVAVVKQDLTKGTVLQTPSVS